MVDLLVVTVLVVVFVAMVDALVAIALAVVDALMAVIAVQLRWMLLLLMCWWLSSWCG